MLIFVIPTGLGVWRLCWVTLKTAVNRLWSLRAGATRVLDYSNSCGPSHSCCRRSGLRGRPATDASHCTIGGRSGRVGAQRVRCRHLGLSIGRRGLERDAKRFQQIPKNCSVCAKMYRDDKQRPFESVYPDPQTDDHRLGDEAVHGVVQHVIRPADFVIIRPPMHDESGQISKDVDVSEQ